MSHLARPAVLITGSSSGIGQACVHELAAAGFFVFAGVRSQPDAERLLQLGVGVVCPVTLDVTRSEEIAAVAARLTIELAGRGLAALVNNAGVAMAGPLETMSIDRFRELCAVNVVGLTAVTQAVLPLLQQAHGRIVNIGSVSGRQARPFLSAYCATKFALDGLSDSWRVELRRLGVSVSLLSVGRVRTPIWRKTAHELTSAYDTLPDEPRQRYARIVAQLRQWMTREDGVAPEVVAKTVARIVTARRPRRRYRVGTSLLAELVWAHTPGAARDRRLARKLPEYD